MRKIRIAQIGMSRYTHAPQIFTTMKLHPEVFDLVGYAVVEDERETCADMIEEYYAGYEELSIEEILNDPTIEAVTVETDEIHLLKYAQMAADAGKHIHMEKPGSQSFEDFEKLINTIKRSGKVFNMGYMYRYNPCVSEIIQRARIGELGEIHSIEAQMNCIHSKETREWLKTFRGGMMFYLGCHMIDIALSIMGAPNSVSVFNRQTGISGVHSEDFAMAILEYKNGTAIIKSDASELGGYARRQIVVTGSKGTVELKPLEMHAPSMEEYELYTNMTEYTSRDWGDMGKNKRCVFHRYADMLLSFAKMVRGEAENPYTPDYELELFKTILKCCGIKDSER